MVGGAWRTTGGAVLVTPSCNPHQQHFGEGHTERRYGAVEEEEGEEEEKKEAGAAGVGKGKGWERIEVRWGM